MPPNAQDFHDWLQIEPEYATAVGYFSIAFSEMERLLNYAIWSSLGIFTGPVGHSITAPIMNVAARAHLLARLGKYQIEDKVLRDDCAAAVKAVLVVNDHRNNLLHGFLHADPTEDEPTILRVKAPKDKVILDIHSA